MAFIQAMTKLGVNGTDVYTEEGVGDYRVTLFTMLNRGLEDKYIQDNVSKIYNRDISDELRDLFVMAFQTRDVRGGKGEKMLFYQFITALYAHDKETVRKMIKLIPEYGCWRDMWELHKRIPELEKDILQFTCEAFQLDFAKFQVNKPLSLLSKWLPREKSIYKGLARKLADAIYNLEPSARNRIVMYRKDVSAMNKALKTVEINMCNSTWASITPEAVPGRCLKGHTKAFLNKKLKCDEIRYPENEDRMECREHFQEFIESLKTGTKKAHGANVVMPHELVVKALKISTTVEEHGINQGQWESIRNETLKLGGLGKSVAMCDFSGSMDGIPKLVSLALGILISEITHDSFKNNILTFESRPTWHSFTGKTLKEKLDSIGDISQGTSTDFYYACMCIIKKMKEHKVPIGEEPEDLIVLTDMGFDEVIDKKYNKEKWSTQIQDIREEFKKAGEEVWGKAWKPPRIIIWNIRAAFKDFHATAHEEGVVQLSGWSPSMLKALQNGLQVNTPMEGMRAILDNERYDKVRDIWNKRA